MPFWSGVTNWIGNAVSDAGDVAKGAAENYAGITHTNVDPYDVNEGAYDRPDAQGDVTKYGDLAEAARIRIAPSIYSTDYKGDRLRSGESRAMEIGGLANLNRGIGLANEGVGVSRDALGSGRQGLAYAAEGVDAQRTGLGVGREAINFQRQAALGLGPSVAQFQMQRGLNQGIGQIASTAASARGGGANQAAAMQEALRAQAGLTGDVVARSAELRAQEMMQARAGLANAGAAYGAQAGQLGAGYLNASQNMGNLASGFNSSVAGYNNAATGLQGALGNIANQDIQKMGLSGNLGVQQAGVDLQSRGLNDSTGLAYEKMGYDVKSGVQAGRVGADAANQSAYSASKGLEVGQDQHNATATSGAIKDGINAVTDIAAKSDANLKFQIRPLTSSVDAKTGIQSLGNVGASPMAQPLLQMPSLGAKGGGEFGGGMYGQTPGVGDRGETMGGAASTGRVNWQELSKGLAGAYQGGGMQKQGWGVASDAHSKEAIQKLSAENDALKSTLKDYTVAGSVEGTRQYAAKPGDVERNAAANRAESERQHEAYVAMKAQRDAAAAERDAVPAPVRAGFTAAKPYLAEAGRFGSFLANGGVGGAAARGLVAAAPAAMQAAAVPPEAQANLTSDANSKQEIASLKAQLAAATGQHQGGFMGGRSFLSGSDGKSVLDGNGGKPSFLSRLVAGTKKPNGLDMSPNAVAMRNAEAQRVGAANEHMTDWYKGAEARKMAVDGLSGVPMGLHHDEATPARPAPAPLNWEGGAPVSPSEAARRIGAGSTPIGAAPSSGGGDFIGGPMPTQADLAASRRYAAEHGDLTSDERAKSDAAKAEPAKFLDSLEGYRFHYKPGVEGEDPTQERYGVMAQDVARTPMGASVVQEGPQGLQLDVKHGFGVTLASLANLNDRLRAVEGKKR